MRGTYTLILVCKKAFRTRIGKLGYVNVGRGYYLYTGSALGEGAVSLEGRLNRHLRTSKKRQWHVDYLTSNPNCSVRFGIRVNLAKHLECLVNQAIAKKLDVRPLLPSAGSSDCGCDGHLTRVMPLMSQREMLNILTSVYRAFGKPFTFCPRVARLRGLSPICSGKRRGRF